jgi:hypothetical protein
MVIVFFVCLFQISWLKTHTLELIKWIHMELKMVSYFNTVFTTCFLPIAACYTHSLLFGNCEYLLEIKLFFVINLKFIEIILFYSIQTCFKILFCCRSTCFILILSCCNSANTAGIVC